MAKVFTFTDQAVRVQFYTDFQPQITSLANAQGNFTVMSISGLNPQNLSNSFHQKLLSQFRQLPYTVQAFVAFAQLRGLGLLVAEPNGSQSVTLVVENPGPSSF